MTAKRVLITGGAGFIGSYVADELLRHGYTVRGLDNLDAQVHGTEHKRPAYLHSDVELLVGDVRDSDAVQKALQDVDAVFHFAALVGVGQSMYEMRRYTDVNNGGTATLLECLMRRPVERLVVASSMSVYGEGLYHGPNGCPLAARERTRAQFEAHDWETVGLNNEPLTAVATPEWKAPALASVYALSKYDQERLCLVAGAAYNIPTVALRFFNAFGPRQALSNPYTGVLAIFASRFLNNKPPLINEDGQQKRDFVSVHDLARASRLALEAPNAPGNVFNIGGGKPYTVCEIANRMACVLGCEHIAPEVTGKYRFGDIRHCYADISRARDVLGYEPRVGLEQGLIELAQWLETQTADDRAEDAQAELARRGLAIG